MRHCLEKNPEERFHSAHDLAFDLEAISGVSAPLSAAAGKPSRGQWLAPALGLAGLAAALGIGYWTITHRSAAPFPSYHQLTFRRGTVWSARFGSDGKTILYSASWDGEPTEIFVGSPQSPESRPLGLTGADVLSVSTSGDIAVSLGSTVSGEFQKTGTLGRTSPTGGGAPRKILEDVESADWGPDAKELAVVRRVGGLTRLEFPIGKTLYETSAWIGSPRVSPGGDRVAFIDHPGQGDDGGSVAVVDRSGKKTTLSKPFGSAQGLAWSPERLRDLVHGGGGEQPRPVRRLALGKAADARASDRLADDPGHVPRRARSDDRRDAETGAFGAAARKDEGARALLARLVAPRRPFRGRENRSLLRVGRRRRTRLLGLRPRNGRLARGSTGRGELPGALAGRDVGPGGPPQADQPAVRSVPHGSGTAAVPASGRSAGDRGPLSTGWPSPALRRDRARTERADLSGGYGGRQAQSLDAREVSRPGSDHRRREELPRARPGREGLCLCRRGRRADARAGNRRRRFPAPMDRRWPRPLRAAQRRSRGADRAARPCDRTLRAVEGDPAGGLGRRGPGLLGPRVPGWDRSTRTRTLESSRTCFSSRA